MTLDLTSLIVLHIAMMAAFSLLLGAISWIDSDWRFPWRFSLGFLIAPSVMVLPGLGLKHDMPNLVLIGMISGFFGPALIGVAASQLTGAGWPATRWALPFLLYAGAHLVVFVAGLGMTGHLLALNVFLCAFGSVLFFIARRLPKEDYPLCRPLILSLAAVTTLAQMVRVAVILHGGVETVDWRSLSMTMIVGATVIAAFGVAGVVILVAERFSAQIRREARTDALTGVAARRVFDDQIVAELERWKRYRRPFAIVLFDIDFFKKVNDVHGHDVGDAALKLVADCGRPQIRPSDLFARLGGDEFGLLLPESGVREASDVAERVRAALRETPLETEQGPVKLTGSFGVAASMNADDTVEAIMKRADLALYLVKGRGRDGVAAYPEADETLLADPVSQRAV